MKVALVNTTDKIGGAAVAAQRLGAALNEYGTPTRLLVGERLTDLDFVEETRSSKFSGKMRFLSERLRFMFFDEANRDVRFAFSTGDTGEDISRHPVIQDADIIHLHWINNGFLSLKSIEKLMKLGKPVVWTLHDMWAFTGGCHYSGTCERYKDACGQCPFLKKPSDTDLSARVWKNKQSMYAHGKVQFITCSNWLRDTARQSSLFNDQRVESIPNPIDTSFWNEGSTEEARTHFGLPQDKKLLLFGAMNVGDKRKGFKYLKEALEQTADIPDIELIVFGKAREGVDIAGYKTHHLGSLSSMEDIRAAYRAADLFALPSLEDNLPNTVMESLSVGTPVVAFNIGGIPQMVADEQTGFLANAKSSESFADGIRRAFSADDQALKTAALQKVANEFANKVVAQRYTEMYQSLL